MAFDLGDPIPLAVTTKNVSGIPENASAVALTITLPDGTSISPALTNAGAGQYSPTVAYLSTMAGLHQVSWVATGVNAATFTDVFNVLPADPHFLISLADARRGIRLSGTATDEDLRDLIADVTPIMENICGPILRSPRVETYDGGSSQIALLGAPLVAVSGVIESYGESYQRVLTAQNIFTGTGADDSYGYTAELPTGIVTRRASGIAVPFAPGRRNIQVSYTCGRGVVGGNILRASRYLIRHLWQLEQGQVPLVNGVPVPTTVILGFAVPNMVIEMCGGDVRGPGLA